MKLTIAGVAAFALVLPVAAHAAGEPPASVQAAPRDIIPPQLDPEQRAGYRAIFANIREQKWQDAQLQLTSLKPGPLHAIALAEILTSKGSPKAELDPLAKLLAEAPELPQARQIFTMAASRGGVGLPPLPEARALTWIDGAPARKRAKSIGNGDMIAVELALKMQPFIKADSGSDAQGLLESTQGLSPESITEGQRKIAWMYFLAGDDNNARAMAAKAASGSSDFAVEAVWVGALAAWRKAADALRASRRVTGDALARDVTQLIGTLGMEAGRFEVELAPIAIVDTPDPNGTERAEFLVSANPGQPPRPLRRIASGGELSRISLAIEVAMQGLDAVPTMVFDEVDAGIGGAVAAAVGARLRALGDARQVLCVTHQPQVAAAGHDQYRVSKAARDGITQSSVVRLDAEGRVGEIARMLGGAEITREAQAAARRLLDEL